MNAASYETPTRALLAHVRTSEDRAAVLSDLDFMLQVSESWSMLCGLVFRHANRLLLADADAPAARGWLAFVREIAVVDAVIKLEVEVEGITGDADGSG